jgi:hypothetical protein
LDSTLTAVVIGGVIAGVPALLAARMNVRSVEALSRSERDEQRRVTRAELYADFVTSVTSSEAQVAAMQEALLELALRGTPDVVEVDGAGEEWNTRFTRQISLLRFLGSPGVQEGAERLEGAYHDLIEELVRVLPSYATATPEKTHDYEKAAYAALDASSWQSYYDALVAVMRADIDDPGAPPPGMR